MDDGPAMLPETSGGPHDEPIERDPVIEAYKARVDRSLLREQLRRTVDERVRNMVAALRFAEALRHAGRHRPTP
jgi:hypothetical protein